MTSHAETARVEFRMSADLKSEVEEAAALLGASFTAFATQTLVERARAVKQEHTLTVLGDEARDAFIEMITNPPAPSDALRKTLGVRSVTL
ncbi:hypothetical protein BH11ARM2_BH11ARM2_06720 [soil metagenome]